MHSTVSSTPESLVTVAILTALPKERVAVKAMLDGPIDYSMPGPAVGEYILGTVPSKDGGRHSVVVALCSMGENLAAATTATLLERFPNVHTAIVVGIAGAAPNPSDPERDVRLGDIVASGPTGVVQYDHDKEVVRDGTVVSEPRHSPRPPSARLIQASSELQEQALEGKRPWEAHIERAAHLAESRRPDPSLDVLHTPDEPYQVVERTLRTDPQRPRVFRGTIASGNKLLKNPHLRERLRDSFGAVAVEMEASGVADATWLSRVGYFVVRGLCDYCDTFKNDEWQMHAAIVAAAYTRALLERTRAERASHSTADEPSGDPLNRIPSALRNAAQGTTDTPALSAFFQAELRELIDLDKHPAERIDDAWPNARPWIDLAFEAFDENQRSQRSDRSAKPG